jgi:uncharacterized membrane protein YfcA
MMTGYTAISNISLLVIALACFLTGVSKGGLGGTLGVLITPMAALVLPVKEALGLTLLIYMLGDAFALAIHWRRWESRILWILLAGGLVGVSLGTFVLTSVSPEILQKGLGIFVLLFTAYRLSEWFLSRGARQRAAGNPRAEEGSTLRSHKPRRPWLGAAAGATAGFTSTLAHSGGPPIVAYLLTQRLEPRVFVATSVLFFTILNWIKAPYYYYAGIFDFGLAGRIVWLAPLVPLGVWVGKRIVSRIERKWFEGVITVLLLVAGILLLVR